MLILTLKTWDDYKLLDSGDGKRLEKFGKYILSRPDPQAIWKPNLPESEWKKANAVFQKTEGEKGKWIKKGPVDEKWKMKWEDISFYCKLSPFKHTGVFPEQAVHWGWIAENIKFPMSNDKFQMKKTAPNILNLFGYTGIASLVAAKAGAKVTHVDASFPAIGWARENQKSSGLEEKPIRWILDDAIKFCERELKRGVRYDGIIMDPPIYGHGPKGEKWDFEQSFPKLMKICRQLLNDRPLFVIINAYAISSSAIMLENVLKDQLKDLGGKIECGELALEEKSGRLLSTGIFARWSN